MEIILATNNKGKIGEMKKKLSKYSMDVISQKETGFDIEENAKWLEDFYLEKAR